MNAQTATIEQRERAAEEMGLVDAQEIKTINLEMDVIRDQGILIDLDVSGVSMFSRAASWMELGIHDKDARRQRLSKGQKYLIPDRKIKEIRSIESRMRQLVERYSYRITGFSPYRWIPFTAYETFRKDWEVLEILFYDWKTEIETGIENYRDELANDYSVMARQAWKSIQGQGYGAVIVDGVSYLTEDDFIDRIVSKALENFPTARQVKSNLQADYSTAIVYASFGPDQLDAERAVRANQLEQAEFSHEMDLLEIDIQSKRDKRDSMKKAELEHARERIQNMTSPFEEVFTALRSRIAADVEKMIGSIQKNGYVRGKIAQQGVGLLELYELMAAHDDHELKDRLQHLRQSIGTVGPSRQKNAPERDTEKIVELLEEIGDLAHTAQEDLTRGPSRFSFLE